GGGRVMTMASASRLLPERAPPRMRVRRGNSVIGFKEQRFAASTPSLSSLQQPIRLPARITDDQPGLPKRRPPGSYRGMNDKAPVPSNAAQLASPSYRIPALDQDFLLGDSMRGVRFLLEYAKAEEALRAHSIRSTIVVFGSARACEDGPNRQ